MNRSQPQSDRLWQEAVRLLPGGVNSPVRAFASVGGTPFFVESARGSRIRSVDGREFIDYVGSWGPMILGHAHPAVVAAVREAAARGTSFGIPNPMEIELARRIVDAFDSVEKVRFVNSGTEATMSAIRLARGATGRDRIVKFSGCYHGHADELLVRAGSGAATLGVPDSAGVPASVAGSTISLPYNDPESVRETFERLEDAIACVIVEPVVGNSGVILPEPGYLEFLREITREHGALLIFDEVMTGFRVARGGAQERFGVAPDLTCLGKIIGGGLPVGAYGGRSDLLDLVAPAGPVYQAGTLSGNPLAMAAGVAALDELARPGTYERLEESAGRLEAGLLGAASEAGIPACVQRCGSMLTLFFRPGPVRRYEDAAGSDRERFRRFFHAMLDRGIYLPPSPFEAWFVSTAHSDGEIETTIAAAREAFRELS